MRAGLGWMVRGECDGWVFGQAGLDTNWARALGVEPNPGAMRFAASPGHETRSACPSTPPTKTENRPVRARRGGAGRVDGDLSQTPRRALRPHTPCRADFRSCAPVFHRHLDPRPVSVLAPNLISAQPDSAFA